MTEVYSWKELRGGKVPTRKNLTEAKRRTMKLLRKLYDRGWIVSGVVLGSVARKKHGLGSDLDLVVVSKSEKEKAVQRILERGYRKLKEDLFVSTDLNLSNERAARKGDHTVDTHFLRTITNQFELNPEIRVGINPKKLFTVKKTRLFTAQEWRAQELKRRKIRLSRQRMMDSPGYYWFLTKTVDRSLMSARILLDLISGYNKQVESLSTREVIKLYRNLFEGHKLLTGFNKIVAASENYKKILRETVKIINSNPSRKQLTEAKRKYNKALHQIFTVRNDSIKVILGNMKLTREYSSQRNRNLSLALNKRMKKQLHHRVK